ncbi:UBX domain-containing protein 11 isoform X3 [Cynoglossus semilaevis]|uniref:UBX domain-containing protein 11 n=1 Tax=Cynoglossus semilaevis TaxID=244447 RepID=A0A3P8V6Y1_CYNSE|nr:UBX domain-containing protein 11 isoform X3 [Cynoglossus semilaevis]
MSSPLSMLKKTKRVPLQGLHSDQWGREKVSFRGNLLTEFQAEVVQNDGGDDSSDPSSLQTSCSDVSKAKSKSLLKKAGPPPSDFELMSVMMQRVNLLEKILKSQAQELETKDQKISMLEKKLRLREESVSHDLNGRDDVESRCQQLQNQVNDMERFLNDYGLIWVGEERSSDSGECELTHSSEASRIRDFHLDFDLVLHRIMDLNILTGEGESFVQSTPTGAQLVKKNPVQLRLYSNGIVMFDGPFRSYQEHSTQQFIQDVMDGYFPSELQKRFPHGVPFEVFDKRDEEFIFKQPWERFPGEGRTVCGKKEESSNVRRYQTTGNKLTMDQFLNRMPKVVIKAGKVIGVRKSLREMLQGSSDAQCSDSVIHIDTAALEARKERLQIFPSDRTSCDIITLKVKSEDGSQTYMLKMFFSETMGHLRKYLDHHRGDDHPGYDIISTFPRCCYEDTTRTLQSYGLTSNATLMLRKTQHSHPVPAVK